MDGILDFNTVRLLEKTADVVGFVTVLYLYFTGAPRPGMLPLAVSFLLLSLASTTVPLIDQYPNYFEVLSFAALYSGVAASALFASGMIQVSGGRGSPLAAVTPFKVLVFLLLTAPPAYFASQSIFGHRAFITLFGGMTYGISAFAMASSYANERINAKIILTAACAIHSLIFLNLWVSLILNIENVNVVNFSFFVLIALNFFYAILIVLIQRERLDLQNKILSNIDPLTGIANRRAFFARVETMLSSHYAILLFDVDRFKTINDSHGHDGGDAVLKAVADAMRATLRETDILGRYGGEEFVVFAWAERVEGAEALAERIRAAVERMRVTIDGRDVAVTVSCGVCHAATRGFPLESAIRQADAALYKAKDNGRNRVERWMSPAAA